MYSSIAANIIEYFHYKDVPLYVLVDEAYVELDGEIKEQHKDTKVRCFLWSESGNIEKNFSLPTSATVLLPAETENYPVFEVLD